MTHRVCALVCVLKVSVHSLRLCALVLRICFISTTPLCTKIIHSGRHFTLQLPSFLWILTQNTIIHMQICFGGPPTISKYTGGQPLFSKQSFEMNAHGENFPYSLEGRKQVQIKIHTLWVFQKLTKARKRPCQATSLEKSKKKKHLTAFKLKQSLLNLEARHFFLGLTQFKLAPGEIVPRAGHAKSILKPALWSTGRNDLKPLWLVLHNMKMRDVLIAEQYQSKMCPHESTTQLNSRIPENRTPMQTNPNPQQRVSFCTHLFANLVHKLWTRPWNYALALQAVCWCCCYSGRFANFLAASDSNLCSFITSFIQRWCGVMVQGNWGPEVCGGAGYRWDVLIAGTQI